MTPLCQAVTAKIEAVFNAENSEHEAIIQRLLSKPFKVPIEGYTGTDVC